MLFSIYILIHLFIIIGILIESISIFIKNYFYFLISTFLFYSSDSIILSPKSDQYIHEKLSDFHKIKECSSELDINEEFFNYAMVGLLNKKVIKKSNFNV